MIPLTIRKRSGLARELYWALTGWLDCEIGKVLRALENSAVARDTIVIYTSDHVENKGDHGLWWKNNMYEHAARIPLIFHAPDRWRGAQRRAGACSLVDLVQTLVEIAGGDSPGDWNGDSMLGWLDNPNQRWKDRAVSEYYGHNVASGFAMLRSGPFKYVHHTRMSPAHAPELELYNLADDPGEWQNLSARPEHRDRLKAMHAELVRELGREPEEAEQECRATCSQGYGRLSAVPARQRGCAS